MTMYHSNPMDAAPGHHLLDHCRSYILTQLQGLEDPSTTFPPSPGPAITIAHQAGSGAHEIAVLLAGYLQAEEGVGPVAWTVFDRTLLEKVLLEHHLPQSLAQFLPEDRRTYIQDAMVELLGMVPPSWELVPQIASTILHLAIAGHVILLGRGANLITAGIPEVFHVRLIASLPRRIERIRELNHVSSDEAAAYIKKEDSARGRYVKANFHVGIDDDQLYHLVLNTDLIPAADAVRIIAHGMRITQPQSSPGRIKCFGPSQSS
jgi:cytidylate kinase